MRRILKLKFASGTHSHKQLMATGNQPVVEFNNWHDRYWGFCICPRCQGQTQHNHLGVLLMQVRAEFTTTGGGGCELDQQGEAQPDGLPSKFQGSPLVNVHPLSAAVRPHLRRDQRVAEAAT